ncbi:MAG: type II toxin-antitoxin system Phd/YefM family antitoxin [bacterium]|nr:type II toxin-antitoxin system Phd/YefM family antitoxin [bacterium]
MDSNSTISISDGRKRIFEIAKEVQKPGKQYTLTENGKPKVVLMSAEEYESFMETMEVLRIFPDLDKTIAEAERDIKSRDFSNYVPFERIKKELGAVADKSKKKYGVQARNRKSR